MPYLTNEVYLGRDGFMFLLGGTNRVAEFFTMGEARVAQQADVWKDLLLDRKRRLAARKIMYYHLFAPEKLSLYRHKADIELESFISFAEFMENKYCNEQLLGTLIPVFNYLKKGTEKYEVYPRTDTHWTSAGCFMAYQMLCHVAGLEQRADLFPTSLRSVTYTGDLAAKLPDRPKENFHRSIMPIEARRVWVNDLIRLNETQSSTTNFHVGCIARFLNTSARANAQRVVLFGDSFSEYRPGLLTSFLADTVKEVLFVWSAGVDWEIIAEFEPDIVITETSERFGRILPTDGIDIRANAANRLKQLM